MTGIAIVDDHRLFRKGLTYIFRDLPDIHILFEADHGQDLIHQLQTQQPEIILLDLEMPEMDGLATTVYLKAHFPAIKVLVLTMHDDEQFMLRLMDAGANGYLLKHADAEEMIQAIRTLATEDFYFNNRLSMAMLKHLGQKRRTITGALPATDLSDREIEVLRLICEECTTSEIADRLFLSARTVETYRKTLFEKTGVKNMAGLVMWAVRKGIVS